MSVTSEVIELKKSPPRTYPMLKKHKHSALIVLFTSESKGTVVNTTPSYSVGDYSATWNGRNFQDFEGTVALKCE